MYVCRGYYSTHLHSISINGKKLSIDPSVFAISNDKAGTIIDSGTTLAYLTEEAYIPFVDAVSTIKNFYQQNFIKLIFFFVMCHYWGYFRWLTTALVIWMSVLLLLVQITNSVSLYVQPLTSNGNPCYSITSRFTNLKAFL